MMKGAIDLSGFLFVFEKQGESPLIRLFRDGIFCLDLSRNSSGISVQLERLPKIFEFQNDVLSKESFRVGRSETEG